MPANPVNQQFLADPVKFMKENIVILDNNGFPSNAGDTDFDLVKHPLNNGMGQNSKGQPIKAYLLSPDTDEVTNSIKCYYLHFKNNGVAVAKVSTANKVFFTAGLSGCSFVAEPDKATPEVKHYDGAKYNDAFVLHDKSNEDKDVYNSQNYAVGSKLECRATVFGVKGGDGKWEFYGQARENMGRFEKMRFPEGVRPI
jgi:hypothetical protein